MRVGTLIRVLPANSEGIDQTRRRYEYRVNPECTKFVASDARSRTTGVPAFRVTDNTGVATGEPVPHARFRCNARSPA